MPRSPPARSGSGSGKRSAPKLATPSSSEDAGAAARAGQASLRPGALVWVTRTQPAADATAQRVRALGFSALVAPLLEVRAVADAVVDLTDVSAIAFTSGNAVAAFGALSAERGLRVFAVGEATAAAARAIGFRIVLSAQGDVRALAAALRARRRELIGPILYPAAAEPAQDLPGALGAAGLSTRTVIFYETAEAPPSASLIAHLPEIAGVLVHSAKVHTTPVR